MTVIGSVVGNKTVAVTGRHPDAIAEALAKSDRPREAAEAANDDNPVGGRAEPSLPLSIA
jgi:hypothetical protein